MNEDARHTAGITTRLIVSYVRRRLGEDGVRRLLELAGDARPVEVLEDETSWSSYDQKIALFEAAADVTADPWVARRIGESVLGEQLGGLVRVALGALGTPQLVLRSIARANVKFSTSATMRTMATSPTGGVVAYRLHDGHQPSVHDCRYNQGLLSQVPALFGLPPAEITHTHCQVEGAGECIYEVRWSRRRRWRGPWQARASASAPAAEGLDHQLAELGRTVTDLISTDDLQEVLARIAARAGSAVHAQHHLLAVRVHGRAHIHADGLGPERAQRLGHQLLATGSVALDGAQPLLAAVASARCHYGWLVAFQPEDAGFLPTERQHLATYAGLAAASLDVSVALQEARRSSAIGAALLRLSHQLAGVQDLLAVARRAAEAAPSVAGSHRASLLLWDQETRSMRTAASVGFEGLDAQAAQFEVPWDATPQLWTQLTDSQPVLLDRGAADPFVREALETYGHGAVAVTPIRAQGELTGLLLASWLEGHEGDTGDAAHLDGLAGIADQAGLAITRVRLLDEVRYAASHDDLTGLASRQLFTDRVERALTDNRRSDLGCAVAFIDLDGFKQVNDTHGHAAGDEVLVEVAARIRAAVRETDSVARLAGDEFAVLLRDLADPTAIDRVAGALRATLRRPYQVGGGTAHLSASIGVACAPEHGTSAGELLRAADIAMYEVKHGGAGDGFLVAARST